MKFGQLSPHTEHPSSQPSKPTALSSSTMEVDMQSPPPSFRPMPFTVKRPRSPGSPTQERQPKRPFLVPIGSERIRRRSTTPVGTMEGRITSQDDWVKQARELSITSPLSVTVDFSSEPGAGPQGRVDEHMAVDCEDPQMLRVHVHPGSARPWSTKTHLPSIHIMTASADSPDGLHAPSPAPFSVLTEPPSSSTSSTPSTSSIPTQTGVGTRCPPDIFLFPATPSDTPSHQFATDYGQQAGESEPGSHPGMHDQASLTTRGQDRLDGSPRPSRTPEIPTASGRKHRVTMGPRADCVKCRTGVRGHWMHFD